MPDVLRTPDARFEELEDWPYPPQYVSWNGIRMHYVDVGQGPVVLLVHGEPDWAYLWRDAIPVLVGAGFRCIAADHVGFGRSDKVVADDWYVVERHCEALRHLVEALDLRDATLVVHDWGGPIGLRQAIDLPERFSRLAILNTWLHHEGFVYGEAIRRWREYAMRFEPGTGDLPCGQVVLRSHGLPCADPGAVLRAYEAPFPDASFKAGPRRFPWCLPFARPEEGNAAEQQRCFDSLRAWTRGPVHFVWGDADPIFPVEQARRWAALVPGATFDTIPGASHFVPCERGEAVARRLLARIEG